MCESVERLNPASTAGGLMSRLSCRCLNISVFTCQNDWQNSPLPTVKLFNQPCEVIKHVENLYEVNLDVGGVVSELPMLVHNSQEEDWIITSCQNCSMKVYIAHAIKTGRVLVFPGVLSNRDDFEKIYQDKNYSPIFKVLLQPIQEADGDSMLRKRVSSMTFGQEDPDMKVIHEQMKKHLKFEEEAMENRIRLYEEEQRKKFSALQTKAHHQRTLLFAVLAKSRENMPVKKDSAQLDTGKEVDKTPPSPVSVDKATEKKSSKSSAQIVTVTIQDNTASYSIPKLPAGDDNEDGSLFTLEGFDSEQVYSEPTGVTEIDRRDIAFPQSDDEDSSTNDSSFRDVSSLSNINLATSVPVSIPLFQREQEQSAPPTSNSESVKSDDVGNSIRLLALSVQDTGMFGDLPRPRMMTNPFS